MHIANSDQEIMSCFSVLRELRPHLDTESFLSIIRLMQGQGYELAFLNDADAVRAVAGFRVYFDISVGGNALYVYDLVVTEGFRSQGYGKQLLSDIEGYAKARDCKCIHLDSNTNRHGAHKFYLEKGFVINAFHFLKRL